MDYVRYIKEETIKRTITLTISQYVALDKIARNNDLCVSSFLPKLVKQCLENKDFMLGE